MGSGDMRWNPFYHRVKSARIDTATAVFGLRGVALLTASSLPGSPLARPERGSHA